MSPQPIRKALINFLLKTPVIGPHFKLYREYKNIPHPPGHYYSTIPDLNELNRNGNRIYEKEEILGIDLRLEAQFALLEQLKSFYKQVPYNFFEPEKSERGLRYNPKEAYYRNSDAICLLLLTLRFKPRRIVEIGSGHSSAIMLDANEKFFNHFMQLTFIEPYPEERLHAVFKPQDKGRATVLPSFVQDVDSSVFTSLGENDILFVDSSHVSKIGSDVNHIFFEILPRLQPGVLIHFHDIFFPFELPLPWITGRKWFWNENYILRAFLMNNPDYEIVLFNDLLHKKFPGWFEQEMPACLIDKENTGSIWIRKIR